MTPTAAIDIAIARFILSLYLKQKCDAHAGMIGGRVMQSLISRRGELD
jgi:hypothetical protein